ncbi:MAG: 16S rRNA (cytidine(1402)-2'-O)-methyltransferase [Chthonomonas sp.]|nr:16S rRNA (cytidine(1402)-2'-O)-methyltransferase [Chthonomonas sp.]
MGGRLVVVAGPIGNLSDLSPRAREELANADGWFVEDTRISGKLQTVLGVKKPMRTLNEHTTPRAVQAYVDEVAKDQTWAVLSDGGAPAISDPGALLVDLAREDDIEVDAIPGPSAVTTALMLSGFYAQRFAFLGFLPRKPGPMGRELEAYAESTLTLVVFESPFRVRAFLEVAGKALPGRRYAICREMSKAHQQVFRAELPIIPSEKEVPSKGEFTIVLEGKRSRDSGFG